MRPFERVHTMTDFYDRPRTGIADFDGRPHFYESVFDEDRDEYSDVYTLRPVDGETLRLALEDWAIWLRWEDAFYGRQATLETHPALPTDRVRHDEIAPLLARKLEALPAPVVRAKAEFRSANGRVSADSGRWLEVRWEPLG